LILPKAPKEAMRVSSIDMIRFMFYNRQLEQNRRPVV
jgi:hypothetical protein